MKIKRKITRILISFFWVLLASGVTVLLVAAIDIKNHKTCRQVQISIRGAKRLLFLNNRDIVQLISQNGAGYPVGQSISDCNLQQLQLVLEKNVWVKEAKLFFDNNFVLHVLILEREPVARVFDTDGGSFYIDSTGFRIPLSNKKMVVQLPVFTGFPAPGNSDSLLLRQISLLSTYMLHAPFWKAQIAQVDITPRKTFEMVPTFGSHLIEFGDAENYAAKFDRLALFYRKVLKNYGFDRYSRISVQYGEQIIGTKRTGGSKIDSLQAMKRIQQLIEESKNLATDSAALVPLPVADTAKKISRDSSIRKPEKDPLPVKPKKPVKATVPLKLPAAPGKKVVNPVPRATNPNAKPTREKPKAVMPKPASSP